MAHAKTASRAGRTALRRGFKGLHFIILQVGRGFAVIFGSGVEGVRFGRQAWLEGSLAGVAGASCDRSSTRSVVKVATPEPKKSASPVQIGQFRAKAVASTGQ